MTLRFFVYPNSFIDLITRATRIWLTGLFWGVVAELCSDAICAVTAVLGFEHELDFRAKDSVAK